MLVDDLLATGGTLKAAELLVKNLPGTTVVASFCLFEIPFLKGRDKLTKNNQFVSIVEIE